ALSGNQCAHPDCSQSLIIDATTASGAMVVGKICHIHAASDKGPRADPDLPPKERDSPNNLILLCPTHHDIVDGQHETYPPDLLRQWKQRRERSQRAADIATINDLGFNELETAARSLLNSVPAPVGNLVVIHPKEKMEKNG